MEYTMIKYVLEKIEKAEICELKTVLNIALRLLDRLPSYYVKEALSVLFGGDVYAE